MYNANVEKIPEKEIYYYLQRHKNRIFSSVVSLFSKLAETKGLTKKELAFRLGKEPAQITRWLSGPGNWTLDTVSDLLLGMESELDHGISPIDKCQSQATSHPLSLKDLHGKVLYLNPSTKNDDFSVSDTATSNTFPTARMVNYG